MVHPVPFPGLQSETCSIDSQNLGSVLSQVVAGSIYRISFSLKSTCPILGGSSRIAINCDEIVAYRPPEVYCKNPSRDNPKCLEMFEGLEENCSVGLEPDHEEQRDDEDDYYNEYYDEHYHEDDDEESVYAGEDKDSEDVYVAEDVNEEIQVVVEDTADDMNEKANLEM